MSAQDVNLIAPACEAALVEAALVFEQAAVRLHPEDDVAIAKISLPAGQTLRLPAEAGTVTLRDTIPAGHKFALRAVGRGQAVRRYGQVIGTASADILLGAHVHTHNLLAQPFERADTWSLEARPIPLVPPAERRTFLGYRRPDGRVGTRNVIAIIGTVNCSSHTVREIAHHFTPQRLKDYPNVDGVIALTHHGGCATRIGSLDYILLQRVLAGMARHPNVGACVLVGLGCEANQIADLVRNYRLSDGTTSLPMPLLTIQEEGGIRKTVQAGIAAVEDLLPLVNTTGRTPQPVSELMVALQCGGSDSWSGVTANPALGLAADHLVQQGGSVVLAETPEIYGAEHLLVRRAISSAVAEALMQKVRWWEAHAARLGMEIDNNPSPGNKVGGLTTIYEKSLGAIAKAGNSPLMGVFDYGAPVTARGFSFMDSPGYDPVSVTGQVAGGCNVIAFTTGRGSVFGFKPTPCIKIASNSALYSRMADDMDMNAGRILDGEPIQRIADELFDLMIAVASGQQTKSEAQGVGEAEFNPWMTGGVL
ncbi:MAG: altronate dehydratase family protein [Anaerolineae bacterium]|nr:altronate dehydratase family protein [Thermoflexales bacterium]MDW8408189.1 altronate dehydratase family protein [Anaerolineae bacterium]